MSAGRDMNETLDKLSNAVRGLLHHLGGEVWSKAEVIETLETVIDYAARLEVDLVLVRERVARGERLEAAIKRQFPGGASTLRAAATMADEDGNRGWGAHFRFLAAALETEQPEREEET